MTTAQPQVDVNEAFAAERATQLQRLADQRADIDRRITEKTLTPLGGGRYRVTDPTSFDDGEIWRLTDNGLRPQHELDTTTGQAALYTRVPAWHGLGSVIPEGTTDIEEVLRLGGINFEVATRPVLYHPDPADAALSPRILPGQYVTVREDTGTGLGVVGHRYTVFQNRETFWFLQDLTDRYDVTWESAGALREGRRVFVCLRLPDTITIDAGGINDEITPFLAAINSHDGSSPFQVALTPWRIVCGNTERFALAQAPCLPSCGETKSSVRGVWKSGHVTDLGAMTLSASDLSSDRSRQSDAVSSGKAGPRAGQATRRIFGSSYKLAIVAEYDSLTVHGGRGALLRREGLYQSHVDKWRRARDRGVLDAGGAPVRARKSVPVKDARITAENRRLVAENSRLTDELAKSRSVVEVMGKLHALLEALSESAESPPKSTP
jgi:hypothetical protein